MDSKVRWRIDPRKFLHRHLEGIARSYKLVLEMSRFDPQKLGKNEASYGYAEGEFEKALLKEEMAAT
jgi:hypothetical protein